MVIDAVLLSYDRLDTLQQVVAGLKKQSCLRDIYIWHNHPSNLKMEGVINIYSEKNFKCRARHAFALNLDAEYILFMDDDIVIPEDYSRYILDGIKKYGDYAVLGPQGVLVDLKKAKKTGLYYDWGGGYDFIKKPVFVDIVKGRFHIVKRQYIIYTFLFEFEINSPLEERITSDDIFINLSIQCSINKPSVVISLPAFEELNSGGLYQREDHLKMRSDLVKRFIDFGWSSKVNLVQKNLPRLEIRLKKTVRSFLKR